MIIKIMLVIPKTVLSGEKNISARSFEVNDELTTPDKINKYNINFVHLNKLLKLYCLASACNFGLVRAKYKNIPRITYAINQINMFAM